MPGTVHGLLVTPAVRSETLVSAKRKPTDTPKSHATRLLADLTGFSPVGVKLDKHGGWLSEEYQTTGFFYTKKIGDRWWLIDPEGHRFVHVAVCSVTPGHSPENRWTLPQPEAGQDRHQAWPRWLTSTASGTRMRRCWATGRDAPAGL